MRTETFLTKNGLGRFHNLLRQPSDDFWTSGALGKASILSLGLCNGFPSRRFHQARGLGSTPNLRANRSWRTPQAQRDRTIRFPRPLAGVKQIGLPRLAEAAQYRQRTLD